MHIFSLYFDVVGFHRQITPKHFSARVRTPLKKKLVMQYVSLYKALCPGAQYRKASKYGIK